jgi:hypothetical protein
MVNGKHVIPFGATALAMALLSFPALLRAQLATASINGTVTDPSGAVVPDATVLLQNVLSGATRSATTNLKGSYYIPAIIPGQYTLRVNKTGFKSAHQVSFTLDVNQTATFNFTLQVGATTQSVTVHAVGVHLEASTAQLGTTIHTSQVNNLPLNGRNFTELLDLTPGVSRVADDQAGGGGGGFAGSPLGTYSFPEINGQRDRSNMFLLDGLNDQGDFVGIDNVTPIIDQIQEFKIDTNTNAQFGGVDGGVINVVTKSGTNSFHGSAWEFIRNNAFDARDTFLAKVVPFKQNQFGGTFGGPVVIPHIYNGRNKTWFFAAYEGFRNHTAATNLYTTATPAELSGDFSAFSEPIYNPFSTAETASGVFTRTAFPNNMIPSNLLNTGMLTYAKGILPAPIVTSVSGINAEDLEPDIYRQDTESLRFDHEFNTKNTVWIRFSGYDQPDFLSAGMQVSTEGDFIHGYNAAASYTHIFTPTLVGTFQFGRNVGQDNQQYSYPNTFNGFTIPTLWQQAGFSPTFAAGFGPSKNVAYDPGINVTDFFGFNGGHLQGTQIADNYEWKGDMSLVHGRHIFSWGADFATNHTQSPIYYLNDCFTSINTDNPQNPKNTGNAMASFLLGVPNGSNRRDVYETESIGWVDGFYGQDQWRVTNKLTLNLGLRFDYMTMPIYGSAAAGNQYVGDLDLNNGTYIVSRVPHACGNGVGAPCIPGGTLPAHVVVTPNSNGRIITNPLDQNWSPRIGLAYRLTPKTVLRAFAGRFYNDWGGTIQLAQNYEGTWPSIGQLIESNINLPEPGAPTPTIPALAPFGTSVLPAANPFNQVEWFMNPNFYNEFSNQWNFGVQRQIGANTVISANYVGNLTHDMDQGGYNNIAVTPGASSPQSRAPYPYISPTFYDNYTGSANYNAFQFSLTGHRASGFTYLLSYTWAKSMDYGCDGWYGDNCTVVDPYDRKQSYAVSGYDLPNSLSFSSTYPLPFGAGQRFRSGNKVADNIIGGWQLNGIMTLTSGTPYNINASGDIANTGNTTNLAQEICTPTLSSPTPAEWFKKSCFANPAPYTLGNFPLNSLRTDWYKDVDLSIFRSFAITEDKQLQFRADFFNAFNNVVWGTPDNTVNDPTFGEVTSIANTPRQIQFALKFIF